MSRDSPYKKRGGRTGAWDTRKDGYSLSRETHRSNEKIRSRRTTEES